MIVCLFKPAGQAKDSQCCTDITLTQNDTCSTGPLLFEFHDFACSWIIEHEVQPQLCMQYSCVLEGNSPFLEDTIQNHQNQEESSVVQAFKQGVAESVRMVCCCCLTREGDNSHCAEQSAGQRRGKMSTSSSVACNTNSCGLISSEGQTWLRQISPQQNVESSA